MLGLRQRLTPLPAAAARAGARCRPAFPTNRGGPMPISRILPLAFAVASGAAVAQVKWVLPAAYPASNFHTENLVQFAADVDRATGGKLKITVHANASLFKAPEIKRAVQGNQAQIGEILLSNFANEHPLYGVDVQIGRASCRERV